MCPISFISKTEKRGPAPRLHKILRKYQIIITSHILIQVISPKSPSAVGVRYPLCQKPMFSTFLFLSFRTTGGYPSNGSMGIFNNGTWKDLCVANWDVVERNLVCQAQGYNGSSLGVHFKSATNSVGNTTYSCEQLTQNCEEKINTEIKCSGIKTFLSPLDQGESLVRRMSIDTSTIIAELNLSLKRSHSIHSQCNSRTKLIQQR